MNEIKVPRPTSPSPQNNPMDSRKIPDYLRRWRFRGFLKLQRCGRSGQMSLWRGSSSSRRSYLRLSKGCRPRIPLIPSFFNLDVNFAGTFRAGGPPGRQTAPVNWRLTTGFQGPCACSSDWLDRAARGLPVRNELLASVDSRIESTRTWRTLPADRSDCPCPSSSDVFLAEISDMRFPSFQRN